MLLQIGWEGGAVSEDIYKLRHQQLLTLEKVR